MQNDLTRIQLLRQKSKSVLGLSKMPIEGSEGNNGRMKEPKAT